jgi:hypothetical protein
VAGDGARCGRGRDAARDVGATRRGMGCTVGMVAGARSGWSERTTRWRVGKFLRSGKLGQTPVSKHYCKKLSLSTSKIVFYSEFFAWYRRLWLLNLFRSNGDIILGLVWILRIKFILIIII